MKKTGLALLLLVLALSAAAGCGPRAQILDPGRYDTGGVVIMPQEKHRFRERVDFITSPGFGDGPGWRERVGLAGGGPAAVVTTLGVFRFDAATCAMYLASYHPGQSVESVRSVLNPELAVHGIVLTMHDARNNLSNQVIADVRGNSGQKVYDTVIPRNVRISEAPSYGKPVLVYDLKCVGSEAYLRLATEIIQREKELIAARAQASPVVQSEMQDEMQQRAGLIF